MAALRWPGWRGRGRRPRGRAGLGPGYKGRAGAGRSSLPPGHRRDSEEEVMEQAVEVLPPPRGLFGALVRACRRRALLSQEQLAERAELSERTVRSGRTGLPLPAAWITGCPRRQLAARSR